MTATRNSFFTAILAGIFAVLTLGMSPVWAALSAEASLSTNQEVMTGEAFELQVQVSDDKKEDLPWPQVQGLDPFQVSKNTSTSSSSQMTIINGHISQSNSYVTTFVYTLTAQQPGTYPIGPIHYAYKDFQQDLGSATITVTKAVAGLSTQSLLSKRKAYVGEQVLYTLRITAKEGVQSINPPDSLQKLIGERFYFEPLDKTIAPRAETVNGQQVKIFDIHIALFPLITGTADMEGIPVEYQVIRRSRPSGGQSMFDMFQDNFFSGANVITQKALAEPVKMEVQALPPGTPAGFTGTVGQCFLSAKVDKSSVAAGDALTLTVTIRSNGQPKSLTKPVLPDLQDFETFDPEESSSSDLQGNTLWTTKVFKYALVPHRQGVYKLSGIAFPYFDPERGAYEQAESPPLDIQVSPGQENMPMSSPLAQNEITDLGSDIRHIKTDVTYLKNEGDLPSHHVWFGALFLVSPLAFAGALALRRRRDRLRTDAAFLRKTQAGSKMRRRFKEAQQALAAGKPREFYHGLSEAVMGFASDALNQEFRGMTLGEAVEALARRGAKPETLSTYESLMHRCDFGQFAGLNPSQAELKSDLDAAGRLLEQLDREIR